jgi:hypothetical protein
VAAPATALASPSGAVIALLATTATAAAAPACLKKILRLTGSMVPPTLVSSFYSERQREWMSKDFNSSTDTVFDTLLLIIES